MRCFISSVAVCGSRCRSSHQLLKVDPRRSTYLACGLLVRGDVMVSDVQRNIERVKRDINMVYWNEEGFKVGLCASPPIGQVRLWVSVCVLCGTASPAVCAYPPHPWDVRLRTCASCVCECVHVVCVCECVCVVCVCRACASCMCIVCVCAFFQPYSLLCLANNCSFRFPLKYGRTVAVAVARPSSCDITVVLAAVSYLLRRSLHDRFMRLYAVGAHLHHYTDLMDGAIFRDVCARVRVGRDYCVANHNRDAVSCRPRRMSFR
jgi:hypothetical protein